MAKQYQSIDPALLALQTAKKAMPASPNTQQPMQSSLNQKTQQSQAPFATSSVIPNKIGGISSPFGATNVNNAQVLGGATSQEMGTRATQLQSLPKAMPKTGTSDNQKYIDLQIDIKKGMPLDKMKELYSDIPESVHSDLYNDLKKGMPIEKIPELYPELSQSNILQNTDGGFMSKVKEGLSSAVQPLNTMGDGLAGLTTKVGEYLDPSTYDPVRQAVGTARMGAGLVDGSVKPMTEAERRYTNKSASQNLLDTVEGATYVAGMIYAPITSAVFSAGSEIPYVKDVLGAVGKGFSFVGEQLKYIPGYKQYRDSLPEEDKQRLDSWAGGMVASFLGSKSKGKITKGDLQGYLVDNFSDVGSLDKAFAKTAVKSAENIKKGATKLRNTPIVDPIVEPIARYMTDTADDQGKLFKAAEPRTNLLNRGVDYKNLQKNNAIANEEIIKAGYKPTDTASRVEAHAGTMRKLRTEVENKAGKKITIDLNPVADAIDEYVARLEKSGVVSIDPQLENLRAQSKRFREMGVVDGANGEITKEMLNSQIKNRGDASIGDVYKNGLKEGNRVLGQALDDAFSTIPGDFSDIKKRFGALKATFEDIVKSDIKAQKAKGLGLSETWGRIEGAGDIVGAVGGILGGNNPLPGLLKGSAKILAGKVLAKIKDKDFLIKEGFEGLSKKVEIPKAPSNKYPIKLQSEGIQQGGATLPKATPKTPPIIRESGNIGQPYKTTPTAKTATVVPSVSASKLPPKIDTFARMTELDSNPLYKKLSGSEILPGAKIKQGLYESPLGKITNEIMDGKVRKYTVNGKNYNVSDLGGIREKLDEGVVKANQIKTNAISALKDIEKGKGKVTGSSLRSVLDELGIDKVDDIPEDAAEEVLKMVRARTPQAPKGMPKLGKETLEQNYYHGTKYDFDTFDLKKSYSDRNNMLGAGDAIYLTESKDIASKYTKANANEYLHKTVIDEVTDKNARKLLRGLVDDGFDQGWSSMSKDEINAMTAKGIDGNDINDLSERIRGSKSTKAEGTNLLTMNNKIELPDNVLKIAKKLGIKTLPGKPKVISISLTKDSKIKNIGKTNDIKKAIEQAKKEGFDGAKFITDESVNGKPEIAVWNTSVINKSLPPLPKKGK